MCVRVLVILYFAISPAMSAVANDKMNSCNANEYFCSDKCIDRRRICDGNTDCPDGIDELYCLPNNSENKIQTATKISSYVSKVLCPLYNGWPCEDGTCITVHNKCDGTADCLDSSDEASSLCMNTTSSPELVVDSTLIEPAVTSQLSDHPPPKLCIANEYFCAGKCIDRRRICDGNTDCPDGIDELYCIPSNNNISSEISSYVSKMLCPLYNGWPCEDGTCITVDNKCDGTADCLDSSDEASSLCMNTTSSPELDVDSASTTESAVTSQLSDDPPPKLCVDLDLDWPCEDGTCISYYQRCDGTADCPDGSDETLSLCMTNTCRQDGFQCTYGACVIDIALCDGNDDCVDKSDELLPKCRSKIGDCLLPPYPDKGKYVISNPQRSDSQSLQLNVTCEPGYDVAGNGIVECKQGHWSHAVPECVRPCKLDKNPSMRYYCYDYARNGGQRDCEAVEYSGIIVRAECTSPNSVVSSPYMRCVDGSWDNVAVCKPSIIDRGANEVKKGFCKLDNHPSVHYYCFVYGEIEGQRACNTYEPSGTIVTPECNSPNYDSTVALPNMRCINGNWNYIAVCNPECGRVTPDGVDLIIDGWRAQRGELPWHVGIYRKSTRSYTQICGGSLVSNSVVISAAHCFWSDVTKQQPASKYAVAVGKLYQDWDHDEDAQKSDVKDIKIPPRFRGSEANFQEDIAVVILETPFVYRTYVRPVCLNFNINFDRRQLRPGKLGKVAGWGLTSANGKGSEILKVVELPYVDIVECISNAPLSFRENITGDKICAGYTNGTALCRGDSGGGLAFPEPERGTDRYYLRGIVSTAPRTEDLCNAHTVTAFTQISRHEHFVKKYL